MKIAFIGQKGIPVSQGGVERHVEELATRLAERGHDIIVYSRNTYQTGQRELPKNLKVITLLSLPIKAWDTIIHVLFSSIDVVFRKVDIIHYHSMGPAFFIFLPKIFKPSAKIIFTHHSPETQRPQWGTLSRLAMSLGERVGTTLADEVISVTPIVTLDLEKKYGRRVNTIPNGVSKLDTGREVDSLDLPPKYVLAVSRLIRSKGLDHLIQAFNLISADYPQYKLLIAGSPTNNDNDEPRLRKLAAGNPNIIFLGWQSSESLHVLFERATVFVHPSEIEGLPITLLEAALYANPILVSDIPEHTIVVGRDALVFKNKNHIDLASGLREILSNLPVHRKQAFNLSIKVARQFNWNIIVDQIEKIYTQNPMKDKQWRGSNIVTQKTA